MPGGAPSRGLAQKTFSLVFLTRSHPIPSVETRRGSGACAQSKVGAGEQFGLSLCNRQLLSRPGSRGRIEIE